MSIISTASDIGDADARGDGLEGIEADADEIDRSDALLLERGNVVLDFAPREDACVNPRVQGLDAACEELGEAGHRLDVRDGDVGVLEECGGSAARDQLHTELVEPTRELLQPALVPA